MTTINMGNIELLLSGGSNNADSKRSIGGNISNFPITGTANNLFPDLSSSEAVSGKTDYRCFYVKNSNQINIYDVAIRIGSQISNGSYAEIGVSKTTEAQRIDVTGASISGAVTLTIGSTPISMNWGSSPFGFSASLFNALSYVGIETQVSHSVFGNTASFIVTFSGKDDNRNWPTMQVQQNNLTGYDPPVILIRKMAQGQPINSSAPLLVTDTAPPSGVVFQSGLINIGTLRPNDYFPVWVKRITQPGTQFSENDGFSFKISGKPFVFSNSSSSS